MKRIWTCLVTSVLAICAWSTAPAEAEKIKVGHDYWVGYSAVFVAHAKGFYEEAGLDVELVAFPGPGDSLPPLIAGSLDLNLTTLHNITMMAGTQGTPISLVYLLDSSFGADAIVARKEITDVAGLKGKKVAVTLNEVNHLMLILALESVGLSEEDVTLVNLDGTEAGTAFLAGAVDAACTWEPWISRALADGSGHAIFSTVDIPNTIINVVCATKEMQEARPEAIAKFIAATDKGSKFLKANPGEGAEIVGKKLEAPAADITEMLATDVIFDLEDSQKLMAPGGQIEQTIGKIITFLKSKKLIELDVAASDLVSPEFVSE